MKNILKVLLVLIIVLIFPISVFYGLRILNNGYTYEYLNRSLVITLPNGVWFELNEAQDLVNEETLIFENDTANTKKSGMDFGLLYPTYTITMENDTATKSQTAKRSGNTVSIENTINFNKDVFQTYTARIYFSKYGDFENDTYTQDGCSVKVISENGAVSYDEKYAIVDIEYQIENSKVDDLIKIEISCL